jgi:Fe-S oxidoreductase
MLDTAKRWLRHTLETLAPDIEAGVPLVGLEPSCVAVFRDELAKMLPHDEDAKRLSAQTFHLAELLAVDESYEPPRLERRALLQGHCHAHATGGVDPEQKLLERMGVQLDVPDSGCCGMAGAWGYEHAHYDISQACGERVLLPAVRAVAADTLLIADGFSCRHQIEQGRTGRRALHLAQVLKLAREHGPAGPAGGHPEELVQPLPPVGGRPGAKLAAAAGVALVAAGLARWRRR